MERRFGSSDDSDDAPVISRTRGKIWARGSQNDAAASHLNVALKRLSLNNRPASEFDNFYTPENRSFYSKSPYFKLDATRHEVRLLKVYPEKKTYTQHMTDHPEWEGRGSSIYSQPRRTPAELAIEHCESQGKACHPNLHNRVVPFNPPPKQPVIACELVDKIPLSRVDGKYHALSYCAGSPKNVSRILINGMFFNAFANLEHAIERTLYSWNSRNPGKELLLWVDQICINQDDQAERSSQVGLMRDIYRRSQDSLICLSTYSRYAQVVDPLNASACNGTLWMRYGLYPRGQTPIGSSPFENIDLFVQNKLQSNDNCALADLPMCFESLSIFLSCPWWSRAWVYQEFIMAPRAYFVYDSNTVSWAELSLVLEGVFKLKEKTVDDLASNISKLIKDKRNEEEEEKLKEEERMRQQATLKHAKQEPIRRHIQQLESRKSSLITIRDRARDIQSKRINLSSSDRKLAKEYLTYVQEVEDIKKKINSLSVRLKHPEVGILPGIANPRQSYLENLRKTLATLSTAQISIARVKELLPKLQSCMEPVASLKKAKTRRRRVFELKELLKHSRRCQASDPRDRIYAFLGLADKDYGVVPKYTCENTIVHILIDVAQKIVTIEGNLSILEHVNEGREKLGTLLPSWVPDVRISKLLDPVISSSKS
jgi:hypothetical protein